MNGSNFEDVEDRDGQSPATTVLEVGRMGVDANSPQVSGSPGMLGPRVVSKRRGR
jgi:hypothetical protein